MTRTTHLDRRGGLIDTAASRPGNDPIFALNAEARQRSVAGEDILNATLGALMLDDGRLATLPSVDEVLRAVPADRAAAYAPIAGPPDFLEAVVADLFAEAALRERSVAVATPGGTGALHHGIANFLEPGQALLTTSHFWGPYAVLADHGQRSVATFEMFDANLRFDIDALRSGIHGHLATQGRALVVLNTPCHNPTGYSLNDAEWEAVAEVVREAGQQGPVTVLVDFAYGRYAAPGAEHWTRHVPTMLESSTVLVAWTASKSFTQYGARVGALVALNDDAEARRKLANALNYSCRATFSNCNHRGMLAVTALLTEPELARRSAAERAELVALLRGRVETFNREASATDLRYPRYEGGFFVSLFVKHPDRVAAAMREEGVYVVPTRQALRLALCATPEAQVPRLVRTAARAVSAAD